MSNVKINYKKIIKDISEQFEIVFNELCDSNLPEIKDELSKIKGIEIVDEQNFVESNINKREIVRVVVKFGEGTANYGASVCPVTLSFFGIQNNVKAAQILASYFVTRWTTLNILKDEENEDETTMQIWTTPTVVTNFNAVFDGFYNLFRISGTLIIGEKIVQLNSISYIYDLDLFRESEGQEGFEEIKVLNFSDDLSSSADPQPFGNTNGFAKSEIVFSTYAFSFSTYLSNNHLLSDVMAIKGFRKREIKEDVYESNAKNNKDFYLKIGFTNGYNNFPVEPKSEEDIVLGNDFYLRFKLVNARIQMTLGELPTLAISFTR